MVPGKPGGMISFENFTRQEVQQITGAGHQVPDDSPEILSALPLECIILLTGS